VAQIRMLKEPVWRIRFLTHEEALRLGALPPASDLRHTWASWHVRNGTPLFAVRRYAHLAAEHLVAPYAERLVALRAVVTEADGTNTAQA
jgi:hypothetical protein